MIHDMGFRFALLILQTTLDKDDRKIGVFQSYSEFTNLLKFRSLLGHSGVRSCLEEVSVGEAVVLLLFPMY